MARKRASLKDKGAETLGLTQKKGKGIDVLFGGPPPEPRGGASNPLPASEPAAETVVDTTNDLSGLMEETPVAASSPPASPPPAAAAPIPDSLPVNEADNDNADVITSEEVPDDLGLPMAMEAPPPDLELAMPVAETVPVITPPAAETPPAPLSLDSLPTAEPAPVPAAESISAPIAEPAPVSTPVPEPASPFATPGPEAMPINEADDEPVGINSADDDLSGLDDDDLAGLPDDTNAPVTIPPTNLPPGTPPVSAAPSTPRPVSVPPAATSYVPTGTRTTASPAPYKPSTPTPVSSTPSTYTVRPSFSKPPSTATGAPSLSMPRAQIQDAHTFGADTKINEADLLPEDTKFKEGSYILETERRKHVEEDEEKARKVIRYIGSDRRENLDREIEELYRQVPKELNDNPEEVKAALKILRDAQDIVFEDARQYDEALYLVATVRAMLAHRKNVGRWSYTWGLFVFFYALVWFVVFVAGLVYILIFTAAFEALFKTSTADLGVFRLTLASAAAGGIGGVSGILYSLYWHVSNEVDFHPRMVMYYLVQPILGFILGAIIYFITAAGFVVIDFGSAAESTLTSPVVITLQLVLGWFAGFRQRVVLETVEKIMRRVLGKSESSNSDSKSGAPTEEAEKLQTPPISES